MSASASAALPALSDSRYAVRLVRSSLGRTLQLIEKKESDGQAGIMGLACLVWVTVPLTPLFPLCVSGGQMIRWANLCGTAPVA